MPQIEILDSVRAYLGREHGQFIAGEPCCSHTGGTLDLVNPATEAPLAQIACASDAELDAAVSTAKSAFKGAWAQKTPYERSQLINRFADLIEANGEELAQLETLCSGKSIHLSRMLDVQQSAISLRYYAGWAHQDYRRNPDALLSVDAGRTLHGHDPP